MHNETAHTRTTERSCRKAKDAGDHGKQSNETSVADRAAALAHRAEAAEHHASQMKDRLSDAENQLNAAKDTIERAERQRRIDNAVASLSPVDFETTRLLLEHELSSRDDDNVTAAADQLRQRKPFLFQASKQHSAGMSAAATDGHNPVIKAAEEAITAGDRASLLRYLRLRRGAR